MLSSLLKIYFKEDYLLIYYIKFLDGSNNFYLTFYWVVQIMNLLISILRSKVVKSGGLTSLYQQSDVSLLCCFRYESLFILFLNYEFAIWVIIWFEIEKCRTPIRAIWWQLYIFSLIVSYNLLTDNCLSLHFSYFLMTSISWQLSNIDLFDL